MHYIDREGNIIVPKPVRPIIDYKETSLRNKKGAKREFRYGNLHIREYDDNYTVHRDNIDPKEDALGHLFISRFPEYLACSISAASVGYKVGQEIYNRSKEKGKNQRTALSDAILAGCLAGSTTGSVSSYSVINPIRKK